MSKQYYRRCTAWVGGFQIKAIFHRWDKVSEPENVTDTNGRTVTVPLSRLVGIVEDADGRIHIVDAVDVRFIDGFADHLLNKLEWKKDKDDE